MERPRRRIPAKWFEIYKPDRKTRIVGFSAEFRSLQRGDVGKSMNQWIHYTRLVEINPVNVPEEIEAAREMIIAAETLISQATGFSPQQIWEAAIARKQR